MTAGRGGLGRFARAEGGVSGVEFAFIAPILVLMFMASIELPRAITTGRRVSLAATTMADLISRADVTDIADVYAAAQAVSSPYDLGRAGIVLTAGGIYLDGSTPVAKVCSSVARNDTQRAAGSTIGPAPAGTASPGDRLVMAELRLPYTAVFGVFPVLNRWTFVVSKTWPVRAGKTYLGREEVVLPGGKPCAAF
ncbi:pilus assembly protein [Methylobacterium sp. E-041]|jgi:Flp pilus assembly protein TadG|uniref:TadE/TadG family type IV pilus assembly protein n=1 Tax=unclassified Methylobacterium TaxID=2615210 RepID=UPI0011CC7756|nr:MULTISPECIES: TadE/TadG family type IV pilus assembly protein [unclassified Methylobacterium]MCJ2010051.1 pilus assembly protein [Methylobacterium sp. J-092]MCJ2077543.1 pilus assembly protein [Methylobacterium sp. E-016]MCJ2107271.1 pilus assembly protein [Methylobacterium sp. E-041]TXM93554.1 pilus assembly protein [Methylobacterium sp. WL116]TXN34167.1 pilus assembly protein [Methylobacterium sp. WL93]